MIGCRERARRRGAESAAEAQPRGEQARREQAGCDEPEQNPPAVPAHERKREHGPCPSPWRYRGRENAVKPIRGVGIRDGDCRRGTTTTTYEDARPPPSRVRRSISRGHSRAALPCSSRRPSMRSSLAVIAWRLATSSVPIALKESPARRPYLKNRKSPPRESATNANVPI